MKRTQAASPLIEPLRCWQAEVLHPRNTDYGRPLIHSRPELRKWRLYDQVRQGRLTKSEMLELQGIPLIGGGATVLTPTWTDPASAPIAIAALAAGAATSGTIALATGWGAYIYLFAGRQAASSAPTVGVTWYIRRRAGTSHTVSVPTAPWFVGSTTVSTSRPTMASSGNSAASATFVTVSTGFVQGDVCFIDDTGNAGLGSSEFDIVLKVVSTVTHTLTKNGGLEFAHNSASAHCTNQADVFTAWLDGGCTWEIIAAYPGTGDTCAVRCLAESFDSVAGT